MFLKILKNSLENTCPRHSLEVILKRKFNTDVFLWISEIFKDTCFYRTPLVVAYAGRNATHTYQFLLLMFRLGENFSQGILVCMLLSLFSVDNNIIQNLWKKKKFTNLMSTHFFRQQCFYNIYKLVFFINPSLINTRLIYISDIYKLRQKISQIQRVLNFFFLYVAINHEHVAFESRKATLCHTSDWLLSHFSPK